MCQEPDWMQYLCASLIEGLFIKSTRILWFVFEMCKRTRMILTFFSQVHLPTQFHSSRNMKGWCFSQNKLNSELAKAGPHIDLKRFSPGSMHCSKGLNHSIQNLAKGANSQGPYIFSCMLLRWNLKSIHWFGWRVEAVLKRSRTRSWPARCSLGGELCAKHLETEPHPNPKPAGWRWKFHEVRLQLEHCSFFFFFFFCFRTNHQGSKNSLQCSFLLARPLLIVSRKRNGKTRQNWQQSRAMKLGSEPPSKLC